MNLAEILVVAIPSTLVVFKLVALSFAAFWSIGGTFDQRGYLVVDRRQVPLMLVRAHAKQA